MNDSRKELATIADPVEAVQFVKTRSVTFPARSPVIANPKTYGHARELPKQTKLLEALLADCPCKNANGETIEMEHSGGIRLV